MHLKNITNRTCNAADISLLSCKQGFLKRKGESNVLEIKPDQRKSVIAVLALREDDEKEVVQKEFQCVYVSLLGRTEH